MDGVSGFAETGARLGRPCGRRELHAVERPQVDRLYARRTDLDRVARQEDAAPGHGIDPDDRVEPRVFAGRSVDRLHVPGAGLPADSGLLPFNGDRMRVVGNSNGVVAGGATERRLGVVSVDGGDISWIPAVGNPSAIQFAADGSLLWAEGSADGKTRAIKAWSAGGTPRTLWKDHDERWFSPTARDSKVIVSPDGKSVAFVSDRTGWIHVYVMPVNAASESEAKQLTTRQLSGRPRGLVTRQQADRVSPERRGEPDGALHRHRRCRLGKERADRHRARRQLRSVIFA